MGRNRFPKTVVDEWNGLSCVVVSANSIEGFKIRYDIMDGDDWWK